MKTKTNKMIFYIVAILLCLPYLLVCLLEIIAKILNVLASIINTISVVSQAYFFKLRDELVKVVSGKM